MSCETLGSRIRRYRRERGMSQSELGFSAPYISRIENDSQFVTASSLTIIADRLGVTALELETGNANAHCYYCGRG